MDSIAYDLGLLMNFLEHKVLITALFGCLCVPFDLCERLLDLLTVDIIEGNAALYKLCDLHIAYIVNISCVLENCRYI